MNFKPMLAGKCEDVTTLKFPVMASAKLDGVRAIVIDGVVYSRTLKPIPNAWVQKTFGSLPTGTDGELIFGDPTHKDAYRNTVSAVMCQRFEPTEVHYHVFDNYTFEGGFKERWERVVAEYETVPKQNVIVVYHALIAGVSTLNAMEQLLVEKGYEGLMVRSISGPYKQGRSSEREGYLLKVKRFEDAEAVVIGTFEWEHNTNDAKKNAVGHTERSTAKGGMVKMGVLGGLDVRGINGTYKDVEFSIGSGFTGAADPEGERGKLWKERDKLIGRIVKYKYFPLGSKDKPRFPTYLGWRDERDM